jgi:hypothetical protein
VPLKHCPFAESTIRNFNSILSAELYCFGVPAPEVKELIRLGVSHQMGRGVPKDEEKAIKYYEKAADAGSLVACNLLCGIYRERADTAEELRWNKEAALRGCFDSLWSVRKFYELKERLKMDFIEAYAWLSLYEDGFTRRKLSRELWSFQLCPDVSQYKTSSLDLAALMSSLELEHAKRRYHECTMQRTNWLMKDAEQGCSKAQNDFGWCFRNRYGV